MTHYLRMSENDIIKRTWKEAAVTNF